MLHQVKPNQKISSSEFNSDGWWYFGKIKLTAVLSANGAKTYCADLYPRGYVPREQEELMDEDAKFNYMSLFLHSARESLCPPSKPNAITRTLESGMGL